MNIVYLYKYTQYKMIGVRLQVKRQSKIKKHFDELASNHQFGNRKEIFKITIFNNVLDIIITH